MTVEHCIDVGYGWALTKIIPGVNSLRPGAIINGPTVFGACDGALCYAVYTMIGVEPMALTGELSIRYLHPHVVTCCTRELTSTVSADAP